MSTNPKSINYRDPALADDAEGRSLARGHTIGEAGKASTGDAGKDQGDRAKANVQKDADK